MHRLVPEFILKNYQAGQMGGSFQAVGLFVDTSGFTATTDALMAHGQQGAEVLAEVIHATFNPLMRAVFERGGFVTNQEGDAFTALFPYQDDKQDCAWRAIFTAVQIQTLAAGITSHQTPYGEFEIRVKVGLGIGEVTWAIIPSDNGGRAAYFFRGKAIGSCAEAEGQASPGEIVMHSEFYSLVQPDVIADPVGDFYRLIQFTGAPASPRPVNSPEIDLDLASHFFPRDLFTWKAIGEFRQVAYLFVSLPTIRTEGQLAVFMQTLFKLQDRYGGFLSRVGFGDKGPHLMLFWGAPTAHENDVDRLLSFVLELQTQTAIPINGGVTYRISHTGFIGCDLAEDFSPFGRGPNLAARFMTSAPRGEIWLDEFAAQRATQHFTLEYAGEQTFKGFSQPQKVYHLVDRRDEAEAPSKARLVGREDDLAAMEEFIQPIFKGECPGVLVIWGEPGIGKTSLVNEYLSRLQIKSGLKNQVFLGQSDEILRQPFNPFRYWLRRYFQVSDSQGEIRNKRSFNHKVDELIIQTQDQRLADELDRTRSFLGAMVDLYWLDSLYEQLDAKGRYENTILGLAAILQAESRQQPVIFFLEDAHWLDDDTKAFLPRLLRMMAGGGQPYPFVILITSRLEGADLPMEDIPNRQIYLDRLNSDSLASLAVATLGGQADESLMHLLDEQGEGNPFFTEQLIHYLKDENLLIIQDNTWGVIPQREFTMPTDVGSLLVARLDRLSSEVKEVVQTASILGHEFELTLLMEMLQDQSTVKHKVKAAEKEKIWSVLDEIRYIFKHVLLRDAAYQMQIHSRRQALHRLAFEALEKVYPDHPKHLYGAFAYHAEQGGLNDRALYYLELAGQAAQEAYLNQLAENYFNRALAFTTGNDVEKRITLLLSRESIYEILGKNDERQRDLDEMESLVSQINNAEKTLDISLRKTNFLLHIGENIQASKIADYIVSLAISSDWVDKAVTAYRFLAYSNNRQNKYDLSNVDVKNGLVLAEKTGNFRERSLLLNILGLTAIEQNRLDLARDSFEQSLVNAQQTGNIYDQVPVINNLGMVANLLGNYAVALKYYERSLEIARKTGERSHEGQVLGNMGWIAGSIGEYDQAMSYSGQNLRIAREVGDPYIEAYALINLSSFAIAQEKYQDAKTYALQGRELARKIGDRSCEAWAITYMGHSFSESNDLDSAEDAYRSALVIRNELNQAVLSMEPMAGLAWMGHLKNQVLITRQNLEAILDYLENGDLEGTDDPMRVYLTCYRILKASEDSRAIGILEKGYQFLQTRAENIPDEPNRRIFLENVRSNRELLVDWNEYKRLGKIPKV